tara:strand:- start:268 stop:480 length:213 start_codon:yes stop_codon:yes gene_type:complete
MNIEFTFYWQIGIMVSAGTTYEKRKYITIELPFLIMVFTGKNKRNYGVPYQDLSESFIESISNTDDKLNK